MIERHELTNRQTTKADLLARVAAARRPAPQGELIQTAAGPRDYGCECRWCGRCVKVEESRTVADDDRGGTMTVCGDCFALYA